MQYSRAINPDPAAFADVFLKSFTASAGAEEGGFVSELAADLIKTTPENDIAAFIAHEGDMCVGAVIFTRLYFPQTSRIVFLLSPMAVLPNHQGQGLIAYALSQLVGYIVVTYGDPAFYGKTGFATIDPAVLPAPYPLSQPQGWIAQSLTKAPILPLEGPATCAPALQNPAYW
ncbi:N-acetyltransferase [Rhodobacterales bacterium HKCCD6035]|nr:N-acetyltransferase [Rhodobacterales bacterium HKCCD6035]